MEGLVELKRALAHAVTFTLGTMVSGTVAIAATNLVQAHKQPAKIVVSGKASSTTELVYSGRAYLPIGDIQAILKRSGAASKWTAGKLTVTLPAPASSQTGSSGDSSSSSNSFGPEAEANTNVVLAITGSLLNLDKTMTQVETDVQTEEKNNDKTGLETTLQNVVTFCQSELKTLSQVQPADGAGQKILAEYVKALTDYQNGFQELLTSVQNNDSTLADKATTDLGTGDTEMQTFNSDWLGFQQS